MPWFKVDDQFAIHPKAIAAGNAALGLWVRAGSWCAAHLTEGALPRHMLGTLGAQRRDAERLIAAGLWDRTEDGYRFRDWEDYQPTKAQVEAKREADRVRQSRRRNTVTNAVSHAVTPDVTNGVSHSTPSLPVPSLTTSPKPAPQAGGYTEEFEEFWRHYPKKIEKADAFKAWKTALKRTDAQTLIAAVQAYAFSDVPKYVKHAATWLNKRAWEDVDASASNGHGVIEVDTRPGPMTGEQIRAARAAEWERTQRMMAELDAKAGNR